ncbi:MAG: ABC-2 family transporter protein [Chloroflexi bacterium ADurb.Bin360]|nr:MAG: ABC-2 family transporter protein [Chloroflexi bacterium ADurb.Bin360]
MNNLAQAIWVEFLKARRSKMPLFTALGFAMVPLGGGFFMLVLKDPEMARRVGLISAKAQLAMGAADWPTYLRFLTLAVGAGGIILFGLIASWVFGREYSDRTLKDLLALPTSRSAIVLSKCIVIAVWSAALTVMTCLITLGVGAALALPPVAPQVFWRSGITITVAAILTIILTTPIAFAASAWHGYLPPIGVMILAMGIGQLTNAAGWGEYFPWSVPALYAQGENLGPASIIIVILTGILGLAGTFLWWELADQTH